MEKWIEAGKIAKKAKEIAKKEVKVGALYLDVAEAIEEFIKENADLAFPVNISVNEVAAHDTPKIRDGRSFKEGDLVKVDIGVLLDGAIADTAVTIDLGNHDELVKAAEEALEAAIKVIRPGITLGEIGKAIEDAIRKRGYKPIANLTGHSIEEYKLHAGLSIPNVNNGSSTVIEEGTVVAIEPFATDGLGYVVESKESQIYSLENEMPVRLPAEKKIVEFAKKRKGLPFCKRWLKMPDFYFANLVRKGILHNYPILVEKGRGLVSQFEHTVIVEEKPKVIT